MTDDAAADTVYTRTLMRAATTLGGVDELARTLQVDVADLARWIHGESRPPLEVFFAALDIVSGAGYEQRARDSQDAADSAQARADRAQQRADRYRAQANAARDAKTPAADGKHGQLRGMTLGEQQPASNQPAGSKRKPEDAK